MAISRSDAAHQIQELLGPALLRNPHLGDGWPFQAQLWDGEGWQSCQLYVGAIGPSGRERMDELRMQNPASGRAITHTPEHTPLLVGLSPDEDGEPILVAWEAHRRIGKSTRFSLFVTRELIERARRSGWEEHISASGERVVALAPSRIGELLSGIARRGEVALGTESHMSEENEDELEDLDGELEALAEQLAQLSEGEMPDGYGEEFSPFDASDVNWRSNDWLARLASVQPWLQLEQPFEVTGGAPQALLNLFEILGEKHPGECFQITDGVAALTPRGLASLSNRVSSAVKYKDEFAQALEEGSTRKQATKTWQELWEEDASGDGNAPLEVHASVLTWRIREFRDQAAENYLILNPSYQRDSVWSDKESIGLIDSILRGIPLPSIILNQRKGGDNSEIVDGKQRLTAILRFIGHHPDGVAFAKRKSKEAGVDFELFRQDYRKWQKQVRRKVGLATKDEGASFLPFAFRLPTNAPKNDPLAALSGKYYCEIRDKCVTVQGTEEKISGVFESPATAYYLPVILYKNTDIRQIHNVFGLYNRRGKKLNATEVRNAIYHHLDLTRLLLLLSGDSDDIEALAPYLAGDAFDLAAIPEVLEGMGVVRSRFNRTKLTSWVVALLAHPMEMRKSAPVTPGSTKLIEGMLERVSDAKDHPLKHKAGCAELARLLRQGALNLTELRTMEAIDARFQRKGTPSEKWDDLPAVAAWTACTLAAFAGVEVGPAARTAVAETTASIAPLDKQQAKTQWIYLARTVLRLLDALAVDQVALAGALTKRLGNNCLITLHAVAKLEG